MTGLLTRPIVALVKATSSAVELRPYCAAMHSYPSAPRGVINLLKQEPSAQSPWQKTMLGFVCVAVIFCSPFFSWISVSHIVPIGKVNLQDWRAWASPRNDYVCLCCEKRGKHLGPPILEVVVPWRPRSSRA